MKFSIVFLALAALANAIPVVEGEGALVKPSGPFPSGEPHHHHPHPKPSGPHGAKRESLEIPWRSDDGRERTDKSLATGKGPKRKHLARRIPKP